MNERIETAQEEIKQLDSEIAQLQKKRDQVIISYLNDIFENKMKICKQLCCITGVEFSVEASSVLQIESVAINLLSFLFTTQFSIL